MVKKITNIFHIYGINHLIVRMTLRDSRQILEHVWSTVLVQPITAYWHGLPPVSLLLHLPLHFILLLNTATEWSHQNTNRSAPYSKISSAFSHSNRTTCPISAPICPSCPYQYSSLPCSICSSHHPGLLAIPRSHYKHSQLHSLLWTNFLPHAQMACALTSFEVFLW